MKIKSDDYRIREAEPVDLALRPTGVKPAYKSKKDYHKQLAEHVAGLSSHGNWHRSRNPECRDYPGEGRSCGHCTGYSLEPGDDA